MLCFLAGSCTRFLAKRFRSSCDALMQDAAFQRIGSHYSDEVCGHEWRFCADECGCDCEEMRIVRIRSCVCIQWTDVPCPIDPDAELHSAYQDTPVCGNAYKHTHACGFVCRNIKYTLTATVSGDGKVSWGGGALSGKYERRSRFAKCSDCVHEGGQLMDIWL